jgi:putative ribosome biogenesis GTPase RsgA
VIGDYVSLQKSEINGIIKRNNLLARYKGDNNRFSLHARVLQSIAANLDYVVVVASAKEPKFQP